MDRRTESKIGFNEEQSGAKLWLLKAFKHETKGKLWGVKEKQQQQQTGPREIA